MKKIFILIAMTLTLAGCGNSKTRTDVVDILVDNGFSRNSVGLYEKGEDEVTYRIGNLVNNPGYAVSLVSYFQAGPIVLMDSYPRVFGYHPKDKAIIYAEICGNDPETKTPMSSEFIYFLDKNTTIIGNDACELFPIEDEEGAEKEPVLDEKLKEEILQKAEQAKKKLEALGLTSKDLEKLG